MCVKWITALWGLCACREYAFKGNLRKIDNSIIDILKIVRLQKERLTTLRNIDNSIIDMLKIVRPQKGRKGAFKESA